MASYIPRGNRMALLEGYGLLTANILYGMPDFPHVRQEFSLQLYDVHPEFPRLQQFVGFWHERIDAPLYSITIAHALLLKPQEIPVIDGQLRLN